MNTERIGHRIALLRKERHLSQEQLAEQINVTPQAVSKWETGKSLPDTATLPLLARSLGHSIDSLLLPQELFILQAIYTDGVESHEVTAYINQFVSADRLVFHWNEQSLPVVIPNDRIKVLLLKFQTPVGTYYTYSQPDSTLTLDCQSTGCQTNPNPADGELLLIHSVYGNKHHYLNVMQKLEHYRYFRWEHFTITHRLFPSLIHNEGPDYLLLVYANAEGLHAISGQEGDTVHYSSDRSRLFVRNSNPDSHIVEEVPVLRFGAGMDCSWGGALYTALRNAKVDTTYEEVMGVSGACWRTAFAPVWDYSSTDALAAYDYASPAFRAYGYAFHYSAYLTREERQAEKDKILEDIRAGMLTLAIHMRVAPEWGVITGYLDHGNRLLCRSYFDEETFLQLGDDPEFNKEMEKTKGYLYVDHWPYATMRLGEQGVRPPALHSLAASLRIKLETMSQAEGKGYHMGYKALETWRDGLLDEEWYQAADDQAFERRLGVNRFCMMALADARRSASLYLKASAGIVPPGSAGVLLEEMQEKYEYLSGQLHASLQSLPDPSSIPDNTSSREQWTQPMRQKQARLLDTVADLERQGDELAQRILAFLEPDISG